MNEKLDDDLEDLGAVTAYILQPRYTSYVVDRFGKVVGIGDIIIPYVYDKPLKQQKVMKLYKCIDGEMAIITEDNHLRFSDEIEKVTT